MRRYPAKKKLIPSEAFRRARLQSSQIARAAQLNACRKPRAAPSIHVGGSNRPVRNVMPAKIASDQPLSVAMVGRGGSLSRAAELRDLLQMLRQRRFAPAKQCLAMAEQAPLIEHRSDCINSVGATPASPSAALFCWTLEVERWAHVPPEVLGGQTFLSASQAVLREPILPDKNVRQRQARMPAPPLMHLNGHMSRTLDVGR